MPFSGLFLRLLLGLLLGLLPGLPRPAQAAAPASPAASASPAAPAAEAQQQPAPAAAESGLTFSLAEAQALAEANSPALAQARLQVALARQALAGARNQDPQGSAQLDALLGLYLGTPVESTPVTVRQSQRQAEVTFAQATARVAQARQQIRLGVTRAYVEWQKAVALNQAYQTAVERTRAQVARVEAALAAGTAAPTDLIQARSQLAAQEAAAAAAAAGEAAALAALERAIGVALPPGVRPDSPLAEPATTGGAAAGQGATTGGAAAGQGATTGGAAAGEGAAASEPPAGGAAESEELPPPAVLVARALAQRPDLTLARLEVEANRIDLAMLAGQVPPDSTTLISARQRVQQAALALADSTAAATGEVHQALAGLIRAREQLRAHTAAAQAAREAHRLAELRASVGAATALDVQVALAALVQAEADQIRAAADLALAQTNLAYALGEL